jgi:hypothetical protein
MYSAFGPPKGSMYLNKDLKSTSNIFWEQKKIFSNMFNFFEELNDYFFLKKLKTVLSQVYTRLFLWQMKMFKLKFINRGRG